MTPNFEAIERGNIFERSVAKLLHLRLTPGSGNGWRQKGDAHGTGIRVECKASAGRSWAQTRRELALAQEQSQGTGDVPVLAVKDSDDAELVVMTLADFAKLRIEMEPVKVVPTKIEDRKARAATPALLREATA